MFGNRKGKLQEDEESLVPHGLIWHATSEPTPEEVAKNEEALGYTVNYAQESERVRREQAAQPTEQAPVVASQPPPATPSVIPWWRVEQPEPPATRPVSKLTPLPLSAYVPTPIEPAVEPPRPSRIEPLQIRPTPVQPVDVQRIAIPPAAVQPVQAISASAPVQTPAQISQPSTPRVHGSMAISAQVDLPATPQPAVFKSPAPKPQIEERLVPMPSEITEALALAFSRLRSTGKTAWLSLGAVCGKVLERGRQTIRSLELGDGLARAGKGSQNLIQSGMARTSRYARTMGSALGTLSDAGVSLGQHLLTRVRKASASGTGDVVRPANPGPSTPSRIRVLLAAAALQSRIIAAQQLSAWRMRRERAAIDSRFWASMTMSAIAAIIALVIVSVVPHYAAKSLPSRLLNTNPSVDANVAAPVAAAPASKTIAPIRKTATATGAQTTPSKANTAKADSAKSAAKPKHVVHDDYVAPNTYKYYGTGSKSSR